MSVLAGNYYTPITINKNGNSNSRVLIGKSISQQSTIASMLDVAGNINSDSLLSGTGSFVNINVNNGQLINSGNAMVITADETLAEPKQFQIRTSSDINNQLNIGCWTGQNNLSTNKEYSQLTSVRSSFYYTPIILGKETIQTQEFLSIKD